MAGYCGTHICFVWSEASRERLRRDCVCTVLELCARSHRLSFVELVCGLGFYHDLVVGTMWCYRLSRPLLKRVIPRGQESYDSALGCMVMCSFFYAPGVKRV